MHAAASPSTSKVQRRVLGSQLVDRTEYDHRLAESQRAMATLISQEAGVALDTLVPITARPPARLIPMAAMADLEP